MLRLGGYPRLAPKFFGTAAPMSGVLKDKLMSEKTNETPSTETGIVSQTPENHRWMMPKKIAKAFVRGLMWLFSISYFVVRGIDAAKRFIKLFRELSDAS